MCVHYARTVHLPRGVLLLLMDREGLSHWKYYRRHLLPVMQNKTREFALVFRADLSVLSCIYCVAGQSSLLSCMAKQR